MTIDRDAKLLFSSRTQYDAFLRAVNAVAAYQASRVTHRWDDITNPPSAADIGALAIALRLSEFDSEPAKVDARTNLGLQNIDGGTFT